MERHFDFHVRLEWKTNIPLPSTTLRSPPFTLGGCQWCLGFHKDSFVDGTITFSRCIVELIPVQSENAIIPTLDDPIEFEVQIEILSEKFERKRCRIDCWEEAVICDTGYFEDCGPKPLWVPRPDEVMIVCRFYGDIPSTVGDRAIPGSLATEECPANGLSDLECLSKDLGRLLKEEQLPDVCIKNGGRSFPAHRSLLAARSEVFAAMFRNKMAESQTGVVDLKDTDPDVVRHFLQYLYSGKLTAGSGNEVASLYAIADRYAVDSLKRTCTRWIVGGLTEGNCVEYLEDADLHGSEVLKGAVVDFIFEHPDVMLGGEWEELTKRNPELALEVHKSFVQSKIAQSAFQLKQK